MQMYPVTSSNVARIGYQNGQLQVDFNSGSSYIYDNVPQEMFNKFQTAPSKGKFLHWEIKGNYPYRKL